MSEAIEKREYRNTVLVPRCDILESESEVLLIADMPGVGEKDVDIDLQRNCLTIKGSRSAAASDGMKMVNAEYSPVYSYERQFTLGEAIDREGITASMKDGVLKLHLPKSKEAAPRKIQVKTMEN